MVWSGEGGGLHSYACLVTLWKVLVGPFVFLRR
jgi:hypothetical protein